jgi:hypothetical protein
VKHICPRCKQPGIASLAKRWSSRSMPATCEHCGGLCHVMASTSSGIGMAGVVIVLASIIAAVGLHAPWLVLVGAALAIANNIWAWRRARLFPISRDSSDNATKANWLVTAVWALLAIGQ